MRDDVESQFWRGYDLVKAKLEGAPAGMPLSPDPVPFVHSDMSQADKEKCMVDMITFGQCHYLTKADGKSYHVPLEITSASAAPASERLDESGHWFRHLFDEQGNVK